MGIVCVMLCLYGLMGRLFGMGCMYGRMVYFFCWVIDYGCVVWLDFVYGWGFG